MNDASLVPTIETERLLLRGHQVSDFHDSASMWADKEVVAHISGVPSTHEQSWSRLLRYAGHWQLLGFGYWVVQSKANGDFLGEVGLADYHRDTEPTLDGRPEAGWVLRTCAHGKGYATEAVTAMMHWADTTLSCTHTSAMFDPAYSASINVAKKVGFENEVLGRYGDQEALIMERSRQ